MKQIRVHASEPYDVLIGGGLLAEAGERIAPLVKGKKAVVVTDTNVRGLYADPLAASLGRAGISSEIFAFEAGEARKSAETLLSLYDFLAKQNITRSDFLIALGGGVVGDLTGFAAATYLRGIDYVQIPTSLLAQVDSSVGGKTAINIEAGKNLVGAFKQPRLVLADTEALRTLSEDFFADGMGEVIKYGMIASESLFGFLETGKARECPEKVIAECVDIKRRIVKEDEFDTGLRMILNFGHTLGHSIERFYHYSGITHGKAVAAGMYLITSLAERRGMIAEPLSERLKGCLVKYGLPTSVGIDGDSLFEGAVNDKKRFSDTISVILCKTVGKAEIVKLPLSEFRSLVTQ